MIFSEFLPVLWIRMLSFGLVGSDFFGIVTFLILVNLFFKVDQFVWVTYIHYTYRISLEFLLNA
jgi:hypothetical protein